MNPTIKRFKSKNKTEKQIIPECIRNFFSNDMVVLITFFVIVYLLLFIAEKFIAIPEFVLQGAGVVSLIVILCKLAFEEF